MERKKHPLWIRYGVALGSFLLAALVRLVLLGWGGDDAPRYITFYPAVIFVTLYAGLWPGLLTVALATFFSVYWLEPVGQLQMEKPVVLIGFFLFVFTNLLVVWICENMRKAARRAIKAETVAAMLETVNSQDAALKASEQRYRAIFETAVDAIITIDETGIVESINPAGERLFGYRSDELIGRSVSILMLSPDKERHNDYLQHYLRTGEKKIIGIGREVMAVRKNGEIFPIRIAVSEMWAGTRRLFMAQILDITERKKMEKGLQEANEVAMAANASKDQFLATLSHELRTPLTPALMVIAARETDPALDPELREDLATARRNLELEVGLIDDLLDLNRVIRGKIELHLRPQNVHALIRRALAVCQADIEIKRLAVRVDLAANPCVIDADAGRLLQVFWNLLRNAAKFTPSGGSITIRSCNPAPDCIRVEIADTGIGIAPEKIARLFVPFEQGDINITRQFGGMGMGLAISKTLVDLHGGKIDVESVGEGQGTTFFVELPLSKIGIEPEESAEITLQPSPEQRPLKILLVEDHPDTLRILNRLLQSHGVIVTAVPAMAAALSAAEAVYEQGSKFDLVISDLGLPDGDGRELMSQLRERYGLRGIALSGYGMEEDVEKSRAAGFSEHLIKPVKMTELLQALARAVDAGAPRHPNR